MSEKGMEPSKIPVSSSVLTRSQTSKRSLGKKLEVVNNPSSEQGTVRNVRKTTGSSISELNMGLFGDVNLDGRNDSGSNDTEGSDISSVSSKLHVTLDEIIKKTTADKTNGKPGRKKGTSTKTSTKGSLTRSELARINLEIKKLEFESKRRELDSEGKRRELEFKNKQQVREFELRKLELSQGEPRGKHSVNPSFPHEPVTVTTTTRAEVPRMYEDHFNLDSYLIVFERLAVAQGWTKDKWVSRLTSQFNARCQDIFSRIEVSACQDYEEVKQKLLEGYNLGPETYRKEFKNMESQSRENFRDYAVKLTVVFQKWLKGVNCRNYDELVQILLLEKFYASIPKELVALLKDLKLTKLEEAR